MGNAIFKMVKAGPDGKQEVVREINANNAYHGLPSDVRLGINDAFRHGLLTEEIHFTIFIVPVVNLNNPKFPQALKKFLLDKIKEKTEDKPVVQEKKDDEFLFQH